MKPKDEYNDDDLRSQDMTDIATILNNAKQNTSDRNKILSKDDIEQLTEINLIDNDNIPFESTVLKLSTLPNLISLHINLYEEEQVDFVIKNLPNLQYLNGELIDREELQNELSQDNKEIEEEHDKGNEFNKIHEVEEEHEGSERDHKREESKGNGHDSSFAGS